jgi:hypothetical protein
MILCEIKGPDGNVCAALAVGLAVDRLSCDVAFLGVATSEDDVRSMLASSKVGGKSDSVRIESAQRSIVRTNASRTRNPNQCSLQ